MPYGLDMDGLEMDPWMGDGWTDGLEMDQWMDGLETDEWTGDRWMDGWTEGLEMDRWMPYLSIRLPSICPSSIHLSISNLSVHPSVLSFLPSIPLPWVAFRGRINPLWKPLTWHHQGLFSFVLWKIASTFSFKISFPLLVIAFKLICFIWFNGVVVKLLINLVIVTTPRFDSWWDATFAADGLPR